MGLGVRGVVFVKMLEVGEGLVSTPLTDCIGRVLKTLPPNSLSSSQLHATIGITLGAVP